VISLAVTMSSTLVLAIRTLGEISRVPRAAEWLDRNHTPVAFLVLVSLTRLENLRALKTTVCGCSLLNCPIEQKYVDFLEKCGWYHHVTGDLPKLCISLVFLFTMKSCRSQQDTRASLLLFLCSMFSLIFGVVRHLVVRLVIKIAPDEPSPYPGRAHPNNARSQADDGLEAVLIADSVASRVGHNTQSGRKVSHNRTRPQRSELQQPILIRQPEPGPGPKLEPKLEPRRCESQRGLRCSDSQPDFALTSPISQGLATSHVLHGSGDATSRSNYDLRASTMVVDSGVPGMASLEISVELGAGHGGASAGPAPAATAAAGPHSPIVDVDAVRARARARIEARKTAARGAEGGEEEPRAASTTPKSNHH
jgi:hypothetical protein